MVLGTFLFAHFWCRLTKWPDQGTTGRTRGLQTERSFSIMQDFWKSSEALGVSQVSEMLRQLTGQISAHYSPSKILNTHLSLFVRTKDHILYVNSYNQTSPIFSFSKGALTHPRRSLMGRPGSNITVAENHSILHSFFSSFFSLLFL